MPVYYTKPGPKEIRFSMYKLPGIYSYLHIILFNFKHEFQLEPLLKLWALANKQDSYPVLRLLFDIYLQEVW